MRSGRIGYGQFAASDEDGRHSPTSLIYPQLELEQFGIMLLNLLWSSAACVAAGEDCETKRSGVVEES